MMISMKRIPLQRFGPFITPGKIWLMLTQIDEGFSEEDLEANLQRDKHARLCSLVSQFIDELTPTTPDFQLREACDQLVSNFCPQNRFLPLTKCLQLAILVDAPEMQSQLVSAHGMLAILEVLEAKSSSRDVTCKLLQIVNLVGACIFSSPSENVFTDCALAGQHGCRIFGEFLSHWVCRPFVLMLWPQLMSVQRHSSHDGSVVYPHDGTSIC